MVTGSSARTWPANPPTTELGKRPMKISGKAIELATTGARWGSRTQPLTARPMPRKTR